MQKEQQLNFDLRGSNAPLSAADAGAEVRLPPTPPAALAEEADARYNFISPVLGKIRRCVRVPPALLKRPSQKSATELLNHS